MTKPEPLPPWMKKGLIDMQGALNPMRKPMRDYPIGDGGYRTVEWPTQVKGHRERYEQRLYAELILAGGELDCSATGFRVTLPNGDKSYCSSRRCALIAARDTMLRGRTKMKQHNSFGGSYTGRLSGKHLALSQAYGIGVDRHMKAWTSKVADEFRKTIDQDILKALSGDHGVQA